MGSQQGIGEGISEMSAPSGSRSASRGPYKTGSLSSGEVAFDADRECSVLSEERRSGVAVAGSGQCPSVETQPSANTPITFGTASKVDTGDAVISTSPLNKEKDLASDVSGVLHSFSARGQHSEESSSPLNDLSSAPVRIGRDLLRVPVRRIRGVLKQYACFPRMSRRDLWTALLQLPINIDAHARLVQRPHLPSTVEMCRDVPRSLSLVHALVTWHNGLSQCPWIAALAEAIRSEFRGRSKGDVFCFEVIATLIFNLYQDSDPSVPNPAVLARIDEMIGDSSFDPLKAWIPYRSLFAGQVYRGAFLEIMDNIVAVPARLESLVAAFCQMNMSRLGPEFFASPRPVDVRRLVSQAIRLDPTLGQRDTVAASESCGSPSVSTEAVRVVRTSVTRSREAHDFVPLPAGEYPAVRLSQASAEAYRAAGEAEGADLTAQIARESREIAAAEEAKLQRRMWVEQQARELEASTVRGIVTSTRDTDVRRLEAVEQGQLDSHRSDLSGAIRSLEAWKRDWDGPPGDPTELDLEPTRREDRERRLERGDVFAVLQRAGKGTPGRA